MLNLSDEKCHARSSVASHAGVLLRGRLEVLRYREIREVVITRRFSGLLWPLITNTGSVTVVLVPDLLGIQPSIIKHTTVTELFQ